MHIIMNDTPLKTLEHVRQFLNGVGTIEFSIEAKDARYAWIQAMLLRFHYHQLGKAEKGLLLDFLQKVSGYSRIQVKRLIQSSRQTGQLQRRQRTVQGFRRIYMLEDIRLLAQTDELHGTLSGPATKKLCERARASGRQSMLAWQVFLWPTCISYGIAPRTKVFGGTSRRPAPRFPALVNVVNPSPMASQGICGWIRSTKAISMG
jgi:hypothetical protein